jgi:hypothetical protein
MSSRQERPADPRGKPSGQPSLFQLAQLALDATVTAADGLHDTLDDLGQPKPGLSAAVDPWLLYVLCDQFATCIEQASFALEDLADHAESLAGLWAQPIIETGNPRAEHAMHVQLERATRTLRRAARLSAHTAAVAMQPEIEGLVEDLEVRLRVPDSDQPRWVDILQDWEPDRYGVRDASAQGAPVHERAVRRVSAAELGGAIAAAAGLDVADPGARQVADELAGEARRRLAAKAEHRDSARRHAPSERPAGGPAPEPLPWERTTSGLLTAALEDLADRDGQRFDAEPVGLGLAMALAEAADTHPDGPAGLLSHPEEDERAAEHVRALTALGRRALLERRRDAEGNDQRDEP